jgi:CheY-like chemotaxis protein
MASPRILIAEDDIFVRMMIADFLRDAGYQVIEAGSADEAISIFRSGTGIDLLFSDIKMPGSMDGCDLADIVRSDYPGTPVVLTSGYSSGLLRVRNTQVDVVVPKPYRPQAILATIQSFVGPNPDTPAPD